MARIELPIVEDVFAWRLDLQSTRNTMRDASDADEVIIPMNSYGGSVIEGTAFCTILKDTKATTVCEILGVSASMGTIIAISCDKVKMPNNGFFMIHNPSMWAAGESEDLKKGAQLLDTMKAAMVAQYVSKSGQPEETIIEMMDKETWLTGQEAFDLGFVDELTDAIEIEACYKPDAYKNTPQALVMSEEKKPTNKSEKQPSVISNAVTKFLAATKEFFGSEDIINAHVSTLEQERDDARSLLHTATQEITDLKAKVEAHTKIVAEHETQAETIIELKAEVTRLKSSAAASHTKGAEGNAEGGDADSEMIYDPITQAAIDRKNRK